MTLSVYSQLKRKVVVSVGSSTGHTHLLSTLKELFKSDINSPRRYEQINSIGELLTLLEIRDVLSEDNVEPLKVIAQRVSNSNELEKSITDYQTSHIPRQYVNYYTLDTTQNTVSTSAAPTLINGPLGNMSNIKKQRIYETVIEEIGTYWRDLGRNLKVRECVIEDIENNNSTLAARATKLINVYEQKADPQRWFFALCDALEKSRRRDLSRSLQEIMTMNI